jgi:CRP-like cAMP-binding protein
MVVHSSESRASRSADPGAPSWLPGPLLDGGRWLSLEQGACLFHAGDPVEWVYWVARGALKLVRYAPDGTEIVLHRAFAGETFAEASLSAGRYHCEGLCDRDCRLLALPAEMFRRCLREDPDFAAVWQDALARALRVQRARYERLGLKSAGARVLHYLVSEGQGTPPAIILPGTLREWAAELGLAHETLYRTLAELTKAGTISRDGAVIRLLGR